MHRTRAAVGRQAGSSHGASRVNLRTHERAGELGDLTAALRRTAARNSTPALKLRAAEPRRCATRSPSQVQCERREATRPLGAAFMNDTRAVDVRVRRSN